MVPISNVSRAAALIPALVAATLALDARPAAAQAAAGSASGSAASPDASALAPSGVAAQPNVPASSLLRGTEPDASPLGLSDEDALPLPSRGADTTSAINYGKPRPKKSVLYKSNAKVPLPPLVPYRTAPGVRQRKGVGPDEQTFVLPPSPTVAVVPTLPVPRRLPSEDTPFAPVGVDVGTLRLKPFVETGLGFDSNPNRQSVGVTASPFVQTEGGVGITSLWSQHSLTADLRGGYTDYFRLPIANHPDASAVVDGRIDVTRDTKIDLEGRFALSTQTPGSPQLAVPGATFIVNRPSIVSYGTTAGVSQTFNRLTLGLKGTFDRFSYEDATLSDGSTLALSTENYNAYGLTARAAYELTPGLIPFVEATGDMRHHDSLLDVYGYERNSTGISGRAGSTFEISRMLTGDLSAGYANRHYVDQRLPDLNGPTVDGTLTWTATPLTTLTAKANTYLSETTQAGTSGAISRTVSLQLAHALFRNLTLTGVVSYTNNDYVGEPIHENYYAGQIKADYSITRDIILRASYTHSRLVSTYAASSYTDDTVQVGVRLQR
jgi:hypothetical protein